MTGEAAQATAPPTDRSLPPITQMAVASLMLIVIGGIYMAASLPKKPNLAIPVVLVVVSGALMIANVVSLSRLREFAWDTFGLVGKWTLLAYVIIAGMLEYVFFIDHTRGSQLVIMTLMLVIFAVDIPLLLAFSVARYQPAKP
jgi:hypothetical protein